MAHDVFISYTSHDKPVADAVCATLERRGLRCWIAPRDILPGQDWAASIVAALDGCRATVLVFSASANKSPQVLREVELAVDRGVFIFPLRIENAKPVGSFEYLMSSPHWLDALTPPLEQHLNRLAETIAQVLGRAPADQPATAAAGSVAAGARRRFGWGRIGAAVAALAVLGAVGYGLRAWRAPHPTGSPAATAPVPESRQLDDALWRLQHGDYDGASSLCDATLARNRGSAKAYAVRGLVHCVKGQDKPARDDFAESLRADSNCALALAGSALVIADHCDLKNADRDAQRAVEMAPDLAWAQFALGYVAFRCGKTERADEALDKAVQPGQELPWAHALRAQRRLQQGKMEGALADAEDVVLLMPRRAVGYRLRASVEWQSKQMDAARRDAEAAVRLEPNGAEGYVARGVCALAEGDLAAAREAADAAIERAPEKADGHVLRGLVLQSLDDPNGALTSLDRAQQVDACNSEVTWARGLVLETQGLYPEAVCEFGKALDQEPGYLDAHRERGRTYFLYERYDDAIPDLDEVLKGKPEDIDALLLRAEAWLKQKQHNPARQDLIKVLQHDPGQWKAYELVDRLEVEQENWSAVIKNADRALQYTPTERATVLCWRGRAYFESGDARRAAKDLSESISLSPDGKAYGYRARARIKLGQLEAALADFDEALKRWRGSAEFREERAMLRARLDREAEAAALRAALPSADPNDMQGAFEKLTEEIGNGRASINTYTLRAKMLMSRGELELARGDLEQARQLDPNDVVVLGRSAELALLSGDHGRAMEWATQVIATDQANGAVYSCRGRARLGLGDDDGAIADLTEAMQRGSADAVEHNARGAARLNRGSYDDAGVDFAAALRAAPECAQARYGRALAYIGLGQLEKALRNLTDVIEKDPNALDSFFARALVLEHLGRGNEAAADRAAAARLARSPGQTFAVLVGRVAPNGTAQRVGLRAGDRLEDCGSERIYRQLQVGVLTHFPGDTPRTLSVRRAGELLQFTVPRGPLGATLEERPLPPAATAPGASRPAETRPASAPVDDRERTGHAHERQHGDHQA